MQISEQAEHELRQIISFSNNFYVEKQDTHTDLVMSNKNAYLIKNMAIDRNQDERELQSILETLSMHQNLSPKYLMTLLHYEVYQGCDGVEYIKAIYEYGSLSLKQQIQNRLTLNTPFEEDQLWAIFIMVIKALCHLQEHNIVYGVLGTDKIFISETARLLDPSATATNPLLVTQNRLYSPQIINDEEEIDMFKSDIYVLGLLIIECGLLVDLSKQMQPDLNKYFQEFNNRYSQQLYRLLQGMLQIRPEDRPTFLQLKQYLVQQMQLNTTQTNQPINAALADREDEEAKTFKIEINQQENVDILFENNFYTNKENACYIEQEVISEYERAVKKYLSSDMNAIQPFSLNHPKLVNINCASKANAPLSNSNSRANIVKSQSQNKLVMLQSRNANKQNGVETKRHQKNPIMGRHSACNSKVMDQNLKHNYSKSTGPFKQSTRQIKNKLVTHQQFAMQPQSSSNSEIREEEKEYEENSSIFSNNGFQPSISMSIKREQNISTVNKNPNTRFGSCRVSQEMDYTTYRNSRNQTRNNSNSKLFTDPNFLRSIQQDIARISTSKNSLIGNQQQQRWFK